MSRNLNIEARHGLVGICIDQQNASRCDAVVTGSDVKVEAHIGVTRATMDVLLAPVSRVNS